VAEFLLEVGCEEIPAPWLPELAEQVGERFREAAARKALEPGDVAAFHTPRRLVLRAQVLARQPEREELAWGPSLKAARDASGKWTAAAEGFARKSGVTPNALSHRAKDASKPAELYIFHARRVAGRPAAEVLPAVIAAVLRGLAFPKRMSWDAWLEDGKGAFPFGRPIRWLVALLDGEVVPFTIHSLVGGGRGEPIVTAGDVSYGHRFLPRGEAGRPIRVASFDDLRRRLAEHYVLLDPTEREARIREGLAKAGGVGDDHGLPAEWRDLVEYPTVVTGTIPAEFRSLPVEVLETVLVHHQKYVPLAADGRKAARFAAVVNGDGANAAEIVRGMERVVVARLRDAAFFFEEDLKRPLPDRVEDLAGVAFHRGLGSYKDKAVRLVRLIDAMGAEMGLLTKPEHEAAREAALLCKADLTTLMVREFPELQGVMGSIYLRAAGTSWDSVAAAVRWHYHPLSVEEGTPPAKAVVGLDATVFAAVSLADKFDTLAGYFGLGAEPKGSSDPFGLRRAAQGVVRVLIDFWNVDVAERRPNLRLLAAAASAGYPGLAPRNEALEAFLLERLRSVFAARGFPADEIAAVLSERTPGPLEDVHDCGVRLKALHEVRARVPEDFEHLAVAFKRASHILDQAGPGADAVREDAFAEEAERALYRTMKEARAGWEAAGRRSAAQSYAERLRSFASVRPAVDRFFEEVLVMAEDPGLRANRLALLGYMVRPVLQIADISKLGGIA
jgi:glycyl-tRNA synthetase beta chain